MESLTVYVAYCQTMAIYRGCKNRILNALETSNIPATEVEACRKTCMDIFNVHLLHGHKHVQNLSVQVSAKNVQEIKNAMRVLHRYNRQTARLSKIFGEEELSDYHPDTEATPPPTPKPIDPRIPLSIRKFVGKMVGMQSKIEYD